MRSENQLSQTPWPLLFTHSYSIMPSLFLCFLHVSMWGGSETRESTGTSMKWYMTWVMWLTSMLLLHVGPDTYQEAGSLVLSFHDHRSSGLSSNILTRRLVLLDIAASKICLLCCSWVTYSSLSCLPWRILGSMKSWPHSLKLKIAVGVGGVLTEDGKFIADRSD